MLIKLRRTRQTKEATVGAISVEDVAKSWVTLEDAWHVAKIKGRTRIPAGTYPIQLQAAGRIHEKYKARFPDWHRGALMLQDVEGFDGIAVHIGNDVEDTDGCLLIGTAIEEPATPDGAFRITGSTIAYRAFYESIMPSLLDKAQSVWIQIIDPPIGGVAVA